MKRYSNRVLLVMGLLCVGLIGLTLAKTGTLNWKRSSAQPTGPATTTTQVTTSERSSVDDDHKMQRLQSIVRDAPAVADRQVVDIMREAAETRRDDVLPLLIKGLAYNFDPDNQNELMTPDMILPAVQLIKTYYGEKAVPALYREAVNAAQPWYRNRIAVAVRAILSPTDIQITNNKLLQGAHAPDFVAALTTEKVELYLARSDDQNSKKLEELMKAKQRKG